MGRSYDAFGCLFGVRNRVGFRPIAAGRGLPEGVCDRVRQEIGNMAADARNATWIGWDELKTVDWDEPAVASDARMTRREAVPVDGDWKPVWTVMETLAAIHGDTNVRLAAWFD